MAIENFWLSWVATKNFDMNYLSGGVMKYEYHTKLFPEKPAIYILEFIFLQIT
jgi:hypothetical protein